MPLSILAIDEAATSILACVCEALDRLPTEVPGLFGCPCRAGVVAGLPAADACDNGCGPTGPGEYPGQLTVNVVRMYASDRTSFPRELGTLSVAGVSGAVRDARNCALPQVTAVEYAVTVFRCTPLPSDTGCPPSMADLSANALQVHADMLAVQQGILCCLTGTDTTMRLGRRYVMGQTRYIGPQGGCVGFETRLIVALDDCLPCPEPEDVPVP